MPSLIKLLNKIVLNDNNAELGVLQDVALNKADGKCLLCLDTGIYTAEGVSARKNALATTNAQTSQAQGEQLICKNVYTADGKRVGTVIDVYFSKALTLDRLICSNGQVFTRRQLLGVGDVIIARLPKPAAKQKTKNANKHNYARSIDTTPVTTATVDVTTADTANDIAIAPTTIGATAVKQSTKKNAEPRYPKRRYGDFSFLIGKVADKNITNFYGEVMIKVGDKVTSATLRQAKIAGKLIELCLHAK